MPFDMQYVPLFIAIVYCGAVLFGTKLLYKSSIHNQLAAVKPDLVVTTNERYQEISADLKANIPSVKLCVSFDHLQKVEQGSLQKDENDLPCFDAIDVHNAHAIIFQSSGTTGKPKGIVVTHRGMMARVHVSMVSLPLCPNDVMAMAKGEIQDLSLTNTFLCLCKGIKLVYAKSLTAEQHLNVISKYKVNFLHGFNVNTLRRMVEKYEVDPGYYDLSSLKNVEFVGTTYPSKLIQKARETLDVNVCMGYGMTETGRISISHSNKTPSKSVGLLANNTKLKIIDNTGCELGCGQTGEICVYGPQIMKEYFLQDGTKLNELENGWLHSGDLGYYDVNGYIYVVGRAKDAIKIQPGNVAVMPAELEDVLLRHKLISDVAVAGVPHPDHGEAPRAFVVRKDESLTEEEVIQFFQTETEQITSLQGGVMFVDSIPRTDNGKPLRRQLIEKSSL